jgi:hypothetical protein
MADPVVHLTNGVPDAGTGNVTTLGMLLPVAKTGLPTPAADGTNVPALFDKLGKQIISGSLRELRDSVGNVTVTNSTSATTFIPGVSSQYVDIYGLALTNTSATTATEVLISDDTKTYPI